MIVKSKTLTLFHANAPNGMVVKPPLLIAVIAKNIQRDATKRIHGMTMSHFGRINPR